MSFHFPYFSHQYLISIILNGRGGKWNVSIEQMLILNISRDRSVPGEKFKREKSYKGDSIVIRKQKDNRHLIWMQIVV